MFPRLLNVTKKRSFFLFGARNTGKSTLLRHSFLENETLWCDLLNPDEEDRFSRKPNTFYEMVQALPPSTTHIVIDEIQKIPKLLDVVHRLMSESKKLFVMTGSSARKLKRGGANLLAGRAFVYHLFPLSCFEIGNQFDLDFVLKWGSLPQVFDFDDEKERTHFLNAYANTYLKEEIWDEHFIRNLDPFRKFLEVAAQSNGKIVNYSQIAKDVGVDDKTVASFFSLLEDTLIGFFLEPFHNSFRKRLSEKPKFYFFDLGIVRSLSRRLTMPIVQRTYAYGEAFEHFVILEILKLASYFEPDFRFSYLKTPSNVEVDLIIERPGLPLLFIEIKSTDEIEKADLSSFIKLSKDFGLCEAICLSCDPYHKKIEHVTAFHWREGIKYLFKKHVF